MAVDPVAALLDLLDKWKVLRAKTQEPLRVRVPSEYTDDNAQQARAIRKGLHQHGGAAVKSIAVTVDGMAAAVVQQWIDAQLNDSITYSNEVHWAKRHGEVKQYAMAAQLQMAAAESNSPHPPTENSYPIDAEDLQILQALQKLSPKVLNLYDLEEESRVGRKTAGKRVNAMIEHGLIVRPKGPKGGATITPAGSDLLARTKAQ